MTEKYPSKYIGVQVYFQDEWVNTKHKNIEDLRNEATKFGDGDVIQIIIGSSWFEHDTYYYVDRCGHHTLFRGITDYNSDYWYKNKKVHKKTGNSLFSLETTEDVVIPIESKKIKKAIQKLKKMR